MNDLEFLDALTIASSIVWFKTLDENNKNTTHIQHHLDEIDKKLNWIIQRLEEDKNATS